VRRDTAKGLHTQVQRLKEHRSLRDDEIGDLKQVIGEAIENILNRFVDLYDFVVTLSSTANYAPIFARLKQILGGKIGLPFIDPDGTEKAGLHRLKSGRLPRGAIRGATCAVSSSCGRRRRARRRPER
jgi:hypothetical protein